MNITKIFAFLIIPFVLIAQSANAAIVSAEVVNAGGISTLSASGIITDIDGDGDGSVDDISIARITFTIDAGDFVTIASDVDGFAGYMYFFDSEDNVLFEDDSDLDGYSYFADTLAAGTYTVTLGVLGYLPQSGLLGYLENRMYSRRNLPGTNEEFGTWNLTITASSTEVPVPAALPLFLSALIGLAGIARRRC